MLSRWFDFFKKDNADDYYKLGGPRSFYKYKYHNMNIILIGEVHENIYAAQEREFTYLFADYAERHNSVKLLIEFDDVKIDRKNDDIGFLDCMLNLENTSHAAIIRSDKRSFPEGLMNLYHFLKQVGEIQHGAYSHLRKLNVKYQPPYSRMKDKQFQDLLHELANDTHATYTLNDLYQFFESQLIAIDVLAQRYSSENKMLDAFLASCVLGVNDGLGMLIELEKKYNAMGFDGAGLMDKSLADICIDMMAHECDFSSVQQMMDILICYFGSYLDGTLACDIWDEMKANNDVDQTLIVVTGNAHTKRLALLMNDICDVVVEVPADKSGKIISAQKMDDLLHDNSKNQPAYSKCLIM